MNSMGLHASGRRILLSRIFTRPGMAFPGVAFAVPLIIVGLVLVAVGPASALMISFTEPVEGTANIIVATDIPGSMIMTSLESATLSAAIVGAVIPAPVSVLIALREGSLTGPISDLLSVSLSITGALSASFTSDSETPLTGSPTASLVETGLLQSAFSTSLGPLGSLAISIQSDLDPITTTPEPSTLLFLGSALVGLAGVMWRRRP